MSSMRLEPGARIGDWIVDQQLGAGGMGTVYSAHNVLVNDLRAAVKVLQPHGLEQNRERFYQEVRAIYTLRHEHIVRVVGFGEDVERGVLWMSMDLVEGCDLGGLIDSGPLGHEEALSLFEGLVSALCHAHDSGVYHRDLKPGNVLVDAQNRARLVDFGISIQEGQTRLTATGTVLGTPAYLAPEVLGQHEVSAALCDIYATGQLLYEVLTGRYAYAEDPSLSDGMRMGRLLASKLQAEPLDPGDPVPSSVRALVRDATNPLPHARIATADELLARLRDALARPHAFAAPPMMPGGSTIPVYVGVALEDEGPPLAVVPPPPAPDSTVTLDAPAGQATGRLVSYAEQPLADTDRVGAYERPARPDTVSVVTYEEPAPPPTLVSYDEPPALKSKKRRKRGAIWPGLLVTFFIASCIILMAFCLGGGGVVPFKITVPGIGVPGVGRNAEPDMFGVIPSESSKPSPLDEPEMPLSLQDLFGTATPGPQVHAPSDYKNVGGVRVAYHNVATEGRKARAGDTLGVYYTGWLQGSKVPFDSNVGGKPLAFTLGAGRMITGWDRALAGVHVGDELQIVVPPALGYGSAGRPKIPPNSTLVFEIQVVSVTR